jgi:signal peptidase II
VFNPGAAFSVATGSSWIFTIVSVVVAVVTVRVSRRLRSRGWALALGALMGGNLGNLTDRLFRDPGFARGHVVDFLNYNGWFVGNVADIAIVAAAIGIALLALLGIGIDGSRVNAPEQTDAGDAEASGDEARSERAGVDATDESDASVDERTADDRTAAAEGTDDAGTDDAGTDDAGTAVRSDRTEATGGDAESSRA